MHVCWLLAGVTECTPRTTLAAGQCTADQGNFVLDIEIIATGSWGWFPIKIQNSLMLQKDNGYRGY